MKLPNGAVIPRFQPENNLSAFIAVDIIEQVETGRSYLLFEDETEEIRAQMTSTIDINCCGKNGLDMALKLHTVMQSTRFTDGLRRIGAGLLSLSNVKNLSGAIGALHEERGQFEIYLTHTHIVRTLLEEIRASKQIINNQISVKEEQL